MQGIINGNETFEDEENVLNLDSIAMMYKKWIQSDPFDIGITTTNALNPLQYKCSAQKARSSAQENN